MWVYSVLLGDMNFYLLLYQMFLVFGTYLLFIANSLKYCDEFAQGIAEQRSRSNPAGDVIQQ
jgi:hypothetical protein